MAETIQILPYRRSALFYRLNSSGDSLWTLTTLSKLCYDLSEHREYLYIVAGEVYNDPMDSNASDGWVAKIEEKETPIIHIPTPKNHSLKGVSILGQTVYMDPSSRGYLYTLQGRRVLEFSPQFPKEIVTSHFPSGVFLIQYYCNTQPRIRKLVIKN